MKVIVLDKGLILYQFDPLEGSAEGHNLVALVEEEEALFIDTGYAEDVPLVLADLQKRRARPVGAVISHYDPDHDGGLPLLAGVETWGGARWRETAARWLDPGESAPPEPSHIVSSLTELRFGRRVLGLCPLPGHTDDSLAVVVDDAWLYTADTILLTNDGTPLLPSVRSRPLSLHLNAVDWLTERSGLVFIPGHGAVMRDQAVRERDLANRRRYLAALCAATGAISFEEATAGCDPPFLGKEWHDENCR